MAEPSGGPGGEPGPEPTAVSEHPWSGTTSGGGGDGDGDAPARGIVVHPPAATDSGAGPVQGPSAATGEPTEVGTRGPAGPATAVTEGIDGATASVPGGTTAMLDPTRTEPAPGERRRGRGPASFPTVPGYEILEEVGRGGMGVVYRAHHKRMDIPVALKMVLAGAHASDDQLARFEDEARVLAQHRHPNIVQIHNVDEHDGLPYIALEYVPGGTLAGLIAGKPMDPKVAAEHARTLAAAMAYAHGAGPNPVVHRDLKPANVLVAADGTLKITDFGLAKQIDADSGEEGDAAAGGPAEGAGRRRGGGSGSTRTGAILGTPSYMAPEQAWGRTDRIGPASDQYALGVILYEMLTGRPPLQAAHRLQTLELVRTQEPVPPTRLQPRIPRDLETICLKALQKEPHKRYPDCAALAEDLRRFLAGEPIRARPVATSERAWRWCRRHPAIASLSAAVAALGLLLLAGTTWAALYFRDLAAERDRARVNAVEALRTASVNERRANVAAAAAGAARDDAAQQTRLALDTLIELVGATQKRLGDRPDQQDLRRDLLKIAEGGIAQILRTPSNANRVDLTTAAIYQKIGQIAQQTGSPDRALTAYRVMETIVAALVARRPDDLGAANALAKVKNTLGDLQLKELGRAEPALGLYREGLALRRRVLEGLDREGADAAALDVARANVATNHGLVADVLLKLGRLEDALEAQRQDEAARAALSPAAAATAAGRQGRAGMREREGKILLRLGRAEEGRAALEEAFRLRDADARRAKDSLTYRNNALLSVIDLGHYALLEVHDPAEAVWLYTRARDGFAQLREEDRQALSWTRNLAKTWYYLGEALHRLGDAEASAAAFRACLSLREELAERLGAAAPQKPLVTLELALARARCGEAAAAAALVDEVLGRTPRDNRLAFHAACALAQAAAAADDEDAAAASRHRDRALALLDGLVAAGWTDAASLRTDPDLDPLRDDPRLGTLLERLARARGAPAAR
jgi:serine/threonine-protein kinase